MSGESWHRRSSGKGFSDFQSIGRGSEAGDQPWQSRSPPMFVTERRRLVSRLIRKYRFISLLPACGKLLASEIASRLAAMQGMGKNVEEPLDGFRGSFDQVRQSATIDQLLDAVA